MRASCSNTGILNGFTFTEIIVVIVILGILAVLALPQFSATRERALAREAKATLKLISVAEKIYKLHYGFYYPSSGTGPINDKSLIGGNLKINISDANWNYTMYDTSYAVAERAGSGGYLDCNYTQADYEQTTEPQGAVGICP